MLGLIPLSAKDALGVGVVVLYGWVSVAVGAGLAVGEEAIGRSTAADPEELVLGATVGSALVS